MVAAAPGAVIVIAALRIIINSAGADTNNGDDCGGILYDGAEKDDGDSSH